MATTYNDIITIRPGKPAYNIIEEKGDEWSSFIPNEQFNNVLTTVIRAVRGNDIDSHKSFWVNGTYGTGKSHAVSVISHLLGDPVEKINEWIDYEYGEARFSSIKESLLSLRESKRLLPVRIKGLENLTHVSELAPLIQTRVVEALNRYGLDLIVSTDYDTLIKHVQDNPVIWDDLINRTVALSTIVANREMLLDKLQSKDPSTLQKSRVALRNAGMMVMLQQDHLGNWLIEVQEQIRKISKYTGLLIIWDEFTEVMDDAVGIPVLRGLQDISEIFMNEENDSFIFLVSHPSAFNKLGKESSKQTDGRYHRMKYNMESVSAFKIMSRKFRIVDEEEHKLRYQLFYNVNEDLLDLYTAKSNDIQETKENLYKLYPIHPGTANLATHYATTVGSSSRSVFEFIGDNESMSRFFNNEEAFANNETITADFLWDFVLKEFQDDIINYGAVTERYNTYKHRVEHQGPATVSVFKAILLLNAFNNVAADDNVTPTEENIRHLFKGTKYETDLDTVLNWINDEGVVPKAPGGIFSVQFSALPSHELEEIKEKLYETDYHFTSQILKFGDTAKNIFEKKYMQKIIRPYVFDFFSDDTNDSVLKNKIKTAKKNSRPCDLFIALFFAKDQEELSHLRQIAEECCDIENNKDKELGDIVYLVVDTVFGEKNYERFIEYMASYTAAGNHGFLDQLNVHRDHAIDMIKEWMQTAQRGNATIWVNNHAESLSIRHLSTTINSIISPLIFPKGPDALEILRDRAASTFWKPQVSKEIIRTFIFGTTKTELLDVNGVMKPVQYLIQDALDENLEWKADIPENHQFKEVYDFINTTIKNFISHGNTSTLFDLTERFEALTKPPYGLSGNYASAAMVGFAMRPWVGKIYDQVGKPRTADNLTDDLQMLFSFWEKGKGTNKLSFKFQTPQEGKLCKELIKLFRLNKLEGYSDISSMKDARYAITGVFIEQQGYPLWSLKYMTNEFVTSMPPINLNDNIKKLLDNIVAICEEQDQKNVQLVTSTLSLIEDYRADFPDILSKPGSFKNGFENFLLLQKDVNVQESELEEAFNFIKLHLESTIGFWTEEEVSKQLLVWRVAQRDEIEQKRREQEEEARRQEEEQHRAQLEAERKKYEEEIKEAKKIIGDRTNVEQKKVSALNYVKSIDSPQELQGILNKVIDLGYEYILNIILNNPDKDV